MKAPFEQNVLQIDITNACPNTCANCTRFCGHHKTPFFMDFATFKQAVDCAVDYPGGLIGIMGGEPTLHPEFEKFMEYYAGKIGPSYRGAVRMGIEPISDFGAYCDKHLRDAYPRNRRGLFTSLGNSYYKHYELIQEIFSEYQCLNDHQHPGLHQPLLVASGELGIPADELNMLIDKCWINQTWSATITPKGAFFCEVAGALDMLFDGPGGIPVTPGWWNKRPEEFGNQLDWCKRCGAAVPLPRRRANSEVDDVSPEALKALEAVDSPKLRKGKTVTYDTTKYDFVELKKTWNPHVEWYLDDEQGNSGRVSATNPSLHTRHLTCVITCVNYDDYLAYTLPLNRQHFDKLVVATSAADTKTQELCAKYGVTCIVSPRICENDAVINKGKGINDALNALAGECWVNSHKLDWVLHTDADIVLPATFRTDLQKLILNPGTMHYVERVEPIQHYTPYALHLIATGRLGDLAELRNQRPESLVRILGAHPSGYFQLFNVRAKALRARSGYDEMSDTAEFSDTSFARYWHRTKWVQMPTPAFTVFHIPHRVDAYASYDKGHNYKINWNGRKTPRLPAPTELPDALLPEPLPQAAQRNRIQQVQQVQQVQQAMRPRAVQLQRRVWRPAREPAAQPSVVQLPARRPPQLPAKGPPPLPVQRPPEPPGFIVYRTTPKKGPGQ